MSSSAAIAAVLGVAVGLGTGWWVWAREASTGTADGAAARPQGASATSSTLEGSGGAAGPHLEGQDPVQRVVTLTKENTALKAELARVQGEAKDMSEKLQALAPPPFDPKALRFGLTGSTPNFDKADWTELAGHFVELAKALNDLQKTVREGGRPGPELQAAVAAHNTPLAMFAVSTNTELHGSGPNGAYTHPAVMANLIRAALIAANDPLTPQQEAALVTLGKAWSADWERTVKSLPESAPDLARTVAEVDAKQRFIEDAKALLTPSQRAVLFHPDTESRLGRDLLSPGLVYIAGLVPVEATSAGDLEGLLVPRLLAAAGLKDVDAGPLSGVGQRWLDDIPGGREAHAPRDLELMSPTVATLQAWARAEVAAIQRVMDSGRLTPAQAKSLRAVTVLVIPYVVRPG